MRYRRIRVTKAESTLAAKPLHRAFGNMASMLIPTGFWSYTTSDDTSADGKLSQLRALLAAELQQQVGRLPKVNIFQDVVAIPPGEEWDAEIRKAIGHSSFMIPIITPGFLQSEWCCREVVLFREREAELGVRNLIFPLHYVNVDHIGGSDVRQCHDPDVLAVLRTRQWTDFRSLRHRNQKGEDVAMLLESLAHSILRALRETAAEQERAAAKRQQDIEDTKQRLRERHHAEEARTRAEREETARRAHAEGERQQEEAKAARAVEERRALEQAADRGSTDAMFRLGFSYEIGAGVLKDVAKARDWYEKAAEGGSVIAMGNLGALHYRGRGVPQSYAKARDWFEKAAAGGDFDAMTWLGNIYANGQGTKQDYVKARDWYEKAAAAGDTAAMTWLGYHYDNGLGVRKDTAKAQEWRARAAAAPKK